MEGGELRDESPAPNWLVSYGSYRERDPIERGRDTELEVWVLLGADWSEVR